MKYISTVVLIFIIQGCTYLPELGRPYFDYPGSKGITYSYVSSRGDITKLADKVLLSEIGVEPKKYQNRIQTPYVAYSHNGSKYNKACRITLIDNSGNSSLRINCIRVKYEYGFQANSIHNLFTKTWWGKGATDLEQAIYLRVKSEDRPSPNK